VKRFISQLFFEILFFTFRIRVGIYKIKNRSKKKILIFTDSRGHEITKLKNKHNPFSGFSSYFIKNYNCDVFICPEKPTTFYDFFYYLETTKKQYDHIICHVGVVDFAPRTTKQGMEILDNLAYKIDYVFGEEARNELMGMKPYEEEYEGHPTMALVPESFIDRVATKMNDYSNIIWVSCTPIDINWQGNYRRQRPKNSNMVNSKSVALIERLKTDKIVNFTNLNLMS
jgi:hypothetical protein